MTKVVSRIHEEQWEVEKSRLAWEGAPWCSICLPYGHEEANCLELDWDTDLECTQSFTADRPTFQALIHPAWHSHMTALFWPLGEVSQGDDTLKTWDMRNFKKPLNVATGLSSFFPMTDCCFSPDDKLLMTGTSVKKGAGNGTLVFFDRLTFQKVYEIEVASSSVVRCLWHPKLNQIMVGTGNGLAKVYYDPIKSQRGAKLCVVKSQRKEKQAETLTQDYIITPHALPMFREARQRSTRKQLEKDRLDPMKSHKPEPPVSGPVMREGDTFANIDVIYRGYSIGGLRSKSGSQVHFARTTKSYASLCFSLHSHWKCCELFRQHSSYESVVREGTVGVAVLVSSRYSVRAMNE
ncbi:UNVERIFIED_CONTAM: hypothetical protein FKN15_068597 [Acipenser sinensis]